MPGSGIVVEFFGPSCAGKTTLVRRVFEHLEQEGVPVEWQHGPQGTTWKHALASPKLVWWSLANQRVARSPRGRTLLASAANARRLQRRSGIGLLDEGPLKQSPGIASRSPNPRALVAALPMPDVAVLVDCEPDVRIARVRAADRAHARSRSDEVLRKLHQLTLKWGRWMTEEAGVPLIEVDTTHGEDPTPYLAERIWGAWSGETVGS